MTRWYRGPLRRFINTRFLKKSIKKEWTEAKKKKKSKILYKCITANTSVIWQHAAHTTNQLVSWYFEPSLLQQITSGLKQSSISLLFTLHTSHQTTNSLKTTKSVLTQLYI